jgi:hypothetical protein
VQTTTTTTQIRFTCPLCGRPNEQEIDVPDVDWNVEPLSDSLTEDDIDIECQHCGGYLAAHVSNSPSHCTVEFLEYPQVDVSADDAPFAQEPMEEGDWRAQVPELPFDELRTGLNTQRRMLAEGWPSDRSVFIRMVFAQVIGLMEAYLGDTLIRAVETDADALRRLVAGAEELSKEKLSLEEFLTNPGLVRERVWKYLRDIQYHNLAKVDALYNVALGFRLLTNKSRNDRLFKAILCRHDIVHRNGKTKEGGMVSLEPSHVDELIDDVFALATETEARRHATSP